MTDSKSDQSVDKESDSRSRLAERRGVEPDVYQPAEDSGLLAEAAINSLSQPETVLEVGTGSGWVAQQVDDKTNSRVIGSDLNPHACRQARERGVEAVQANLLAPFSDDAFDAVLFNPPYLPTDPDNEWDDWMEHALSGGQDGRRLIVPFLDSVGRVLAPGGEVYLLVSSLTGYDTVVDLAEEAGFSVDDIKQESYPFETLSILKLAQ
jgi:release factor glutamine methyltransferase